MRAMWTKGFCLSLPVAVFLFVLSGSSEAQVRTSIEEIGQYADRLVDVEGVPIVSIYKEDGDYGVWNLLLGQNEKKLLCYEDGYNRGVLEDTHQDIQKIIESNERLEKEGRHPQGITVRGYYDDEQEILNLTEVVYPIGDREVRIDTDWGDVAEKEEAGEVEYDSNGHERYVERYIVYYDVGLPWLYAPYYYGYPAWWGGVWLGFHWGWGPYDYGLGWYLGQCDWYYSGYYYRDWWYDRYDPRYGWDRWDGRRYGKHDRRRGLGKGGEGKDYRSYARKERYGRDKSDRGYRVQRRRVSRRDHIYNRHERSRGRKYERPQYRRGYRRHTGSKSYNRPHFGRSSGSRRFSRGYISRPSGRHFSRGSIGRGSIGRGHFGGGHRGHSGHRGRGR